MTGFVFIKSSQDLLSFCLPVSEGTTSPKDEEEVYFESVSEPVEGHPITPGGSRVLKFGPIPPSSIRGG